MQAYTVETAPTGRSSSDFYAYLQRRYDPFGHAEPNDPMYSFKSLLQRESIFYAPR
jgi:hypothetical protein